MTTGVRIRPMNELDIEGICRIDEKITGRYRPEVWEQRAAYYIRRDPDSSQIAEGLSQTMTAVYLSCTRQSLIGR